MTTLLLLLLLSSNAASNHALLAPPPSSSSSLSLASSLLNNNHRRPANANCGAKSKWTPASTTTTMPIVGRGRTMIPWSGARRGGRRIDGDDVDSRLLVMVLRGGGDWDECDDDGDSSEYETDDDTDTDASDDDDDDDDDVATEDVSSDGEVDDDIDSEVDDDYDTDTSDDNDDDNAMEEISSDGEEDTAVAADAQQPSSEDLERAAEQTRLSSQSRNFGIATALWASLFFDSFLNGAKRSLLFPTASSSILQTLVPTTALASGFGLASVVSFLLWRDAETRADALLDGDGERKGDWFLSLSSSSSSLSDDDDNDDDGNGESSELFASRTRTRLYLHLALFGALSIGANAGRYFSSEAPFLGASAVIINGHNILVCVSALMKEKQGAMSVLFRRRKDGRGKDEEQLPLLGGLPSTVFRVAAVCAWARSLVACRHALSLGTDLLSAGAGGAAAGSNSVATVSNDARRLCLAIASLARLTLVAGASGSVGASIIARRNNDGFFRGHPFFGVLGGALGLGCAGVGGAMLFDAFFGPLSSAATGPAGTIAAGGAAIVSFGLFAIYDSISGVLSSSVG